MTLPVYKIETYTGAVLDHTITHDATEVYFKEVVTDAVGNFYFTVPTSKAPGSYEYDDIAVHDKVKIYMDYDTVGATPLFIGYVSNISAPLSVKKGFIRQVSGLSQGEILLRRQKTDTYYDAVGASTIVEAWCDDLSLGKTDVTADATAVTMEVKTRSYFDLLRDISDHWASAGTQIKKDFYVDVDNDLVWKTRPIRTVGVETFTVGDNILHYNVTRNVQSVKNSITVKGSAEKTIPDDKDSWTESLTNWTASDGDLALDAVTVKAGSNSIKCTQDATPTGFLTFKRTCDTMNIRTLDTVQFWHICSEASTVRVIRLLAPDTSNYFSATLAMAGASWLWEKFTLGPDQVYDAVENEDGVWTETASPNWWDIEGIQFHRDGAVADGDTTIIDGLYFTYERWSDTASDATSISNYGQRDLEIIYDSLHSDAECEKRSETLLYQLKDPTVQIELTTQGNNNVLVGDRISMTLAAEGISAANYDVVSVENMFKQKPTGWITKATMVDSGDTRAAVATTPLHTISNMRRQLRELAGDIKHLK